MTPLDRRIWERLRVKRGDCLPFTGWDKTFTRDNLAELFNEAGFKCGAEVGVRRGNYSRVLCEKIPGLKIMCVDPYIPYSGRTTSQARMDHFYEYAQHNLSGFDATFVRKTSMEAVKEVADGSLDFVYIDAMHNFDNVMLDIIHWARKVRPGGVVAGHDYVETYDCGVIHAVRAYTYANSITAWYLTYDPREEGVALNSWFWVKE